jgi:hypothetical protein
MNKFDRHGNTLYLDMDGVVADFDKFVFGNLSLNNIKRNDWMDQISRIDHFFLKLEPTPYAYRLYRLACSVADNVEFLTAFPSRRHFPTAKEDKIDWVRKHFGDDIKVNFGPYSKDKWKHARPGDILIDDRPDNIADWNEVGGNGILHHYEDYDRTASLLHNIVDNQ